MQKIRNLSLTSKVTIASSIIVAIPVLWYVNVRLVAISEGPTRVQECNTKIEALKQDMMSMHSDIGNMRTDMTNGFSQINKRLDEAAIVAYSNTNNQRIVYHYYARP